MLILARKEDEKILVYIPGHHPVEIQVVEIKGGNVRLGFHAEARIKIHREEVAHAIVRNGGKP